MTVPTLFAVCPVPICSNPVDDGRPCAECTALIGEGLIVEGLIRRVEAPEQLAERPAAEAPMSLDDARRELAEQHAAQQLAAERAAAQDRGELYKPGQHCWVCEERRTCRLDPDQRGEWICKECEAAQ